MMKPLSQYRDEQLQLVQPSIWKRVYELRTPDTVLYTTTCPKLFSSLTVVEGFGEKWEFYKPSIWKRGFQVRKAGDQFPLAKYVPGTWGRRGVFELPQGERMNHIFRMWKGNDELCAENQQQVALFKRKSIFKCAINVFIQHPSVLLDKYPWLIMAVHRIILERQQRGAAS
jgi:hypothetical protein